VSPPKQQPAPPRKGTNSAPSLRGKTKSNKTLWLLGGGTVIVIVAMIVVAMAISNKQKDPLADGFGTGSATATLADGAITVGTGSPITLDIFEDAICPHCRDFENKYGQQIAQAIDNNQLDVTYRPLTFLDGSSSSGDYSSRASAALMCVAENSGSAPGVFQAFHGRLFDADVQPAEGSGTDHDSAYLADLAVTAGAGDAAATCITNGAMLTAATESMVTSTTTLNQAVGGVSSPVILHNGNRVDTTSTTWLTELIG